MSASEVVMQKKDDNGTVTWREYEALRDHFTGIFHRNATTTDGNIQAVQLKLDDTEATVQTMQGQITELQTSIAQLTTAVNGLRTTFEQRFQGDPEDDASVHGDHAPPFGVNANGRGRGGANVRQPPPVHHAQCVVQPEDDGLGKPKFSIPKFEGSTDVEEYLTWELKMEKLWRLHDYTDDRKIKLASSEFDGYALRWWDNLVQQRREENGLPILTWREMKAVMHARFVPTNYLRTVFDKLTQLKQGTMSVDAYYMEMELLLQRARVREPTEMTLQRFLHGLKTNIRGIVRHHQYTTMNELLHHAREAESQLAEEAQSEARYTSRFSSRAPS